jgi:hypothetical protein
MLALAEQTSTRLGPVGNHVLRTVRWADRNLVSVVRRHPVWSAALTAALFRLAVGGAQSVSEGYFALDALRSSSPGLRHLCPAHGGPTATWA